MEQSCKGKRGKEAGKTGWSNAKVEMTDKEKAKRKQKPRKDEERFKAERKEGR